MGTNKHYIPKYFDVLLKLLLPSTEVEWQIFSSLYYCLSGHQHEWNSIKRHWDKKMKNNDAYSRIRDVIALKQEGLPYHNEFLPIISANGIFINIAATAVAAAVEDDSVESSPGRTIVLTSKRRGTADDSPSASPFQDRTRELDHPIVLAEDEDEDVRIFYIQSVTPVPSLLTLSSISLASPTTAEY